VLEGGM